MEPDQLGNRMKDYENVESMRRVDPSLPLCLRIDGRHFSTFTQGMSRPFDKKMILLMQETAKFLVAETNAVVGYTQSDEISLVIAPVKENEQRWFSDRIQKICSSVAAIGSVFFNSKLKEYFPEKVNLLPTFDARVFSVPSEWEAVNVLRWRQMDCSKNSIQMAARSMFSHKSLQDLNGEQLKQKMLSEAGADWNNYPDTFKYGTVIKKVTSTKPFTAEEIQNLPVKHLARTNPELVVKRSTIQIMDWKPLVQIANATDCVFRDAEPVYK